MQRRNFATPIVFATELVKVGAIIYIAVKIPDDNSKVVFCLLALGYIGLIVWKKDKLEVRIGAEAECCLPKGLCEAQVRTHT